VLDPVARVDRRSRLGKAVADWLVAPLAVGLVTVLARQAGANAPTAGFLYLVLVLGLATWRGWLAGAVASVAATVGYNYFFLPPFGTLVIAEPANWVALASFLIASTLASRLVVSARRQAVAADLRRREVEILYELCFGLFAASQRRGSLGEAAARTLSALGARAGMVVPAPSVDTGAELPRVIGEGSLPLDEHALQRARDLRSIVESGPDGADRIVYIPLLAGGVLDGVLVARGAVAERKLLESAGRLLALAVERERLLDEAARLAGVRESDALKTSLLRAVSHDLRTPLTAMRLALEGLRREAGESPGALAALGGLAREHERLTLRIDNLLSLVRLEAGLARPHPEETPPGALFRAAREALSLVLAGRPVEVRVDRESPEPWVDPSLGLEIVVNLLENAARAAPAGSPLELTASVDPEDPGRVRLEVIDSGPGIPVEIRRLVLDPGGALPVSGAGDVRPGGLGLRIAASLARANGGSLDLLDRPEGGTIARLTLPAAPVPAELSGEIAAGETIAGETMP
jgi:two-component system sensor histidine kinase KdpD